MLRQAIVVVALLATSGLAGCAGDALPEMPASARIQVNVPDHARPGTWTSPVTLDVSGNRDVFLKFYGSTKQVGMCDPSGVEATHKAHPVMSIEFRVEAAKIRRVLWILKDDSGEWIAEGYGAIEAFDVPECFPRYRYSRSSLAELRAWYEKNVPEADRPR